MLHIPKIKSFHLALGGAILIIFWLGGGESKSAYPQFWTWVKLW